ncbi:metallophosphoesterase family protein [Deinococcus aluminii]|uniref:Calcineurin-like phosphoesterase domain-containing protein n=1 Tax=Deinococcus aluminii TaxID=1656885 RepID=A0ABP9XC14_9DEIO
MRLAVFGDIHGNLPALRAALADMRAQGAEAFVCLGDVAMDGAWPRECVAEVAALGCPVVRGNADREMLESPRLFTPRGFPDEREIWEIGNWSAAQLTDGEREVLRGYVPTAEFPDLLCFHGSPERDNEELTAQTPDARLEELRTAHGRQAIWVGGHTHKPLLRTLDGWTLLNPGSVGLPFERRGERYVNPARAEYLLLERRAGGWQPTFRAVPYDVEEVRRGLLASGMPHAAWAAGDWVAG